MIVNSEKHFMNRVDVILRAMLNLGGDAKALDMEDIAIECRRLSPDTFAWRKYPSQINLELVAVTLRDAKKPKYGTLVSGGQARGWRLTENGLSMASSVEEDAAGGKVTPAKPRAPFRGAEGKKIRREHDRVLSSSAYKSWVSSGQSSAQELHELLKINAYTSDELITIKKTRLARCRGISSELDNFIDYLMGTEI